MQSIRFLTNLLHFICIFNVFYLEEKGLKVKNGGKVGGKMKGDENEGKVGEDTIAKDKQQKDTE